MTRDRGVGAGVTTVWQFSIRKLPSGGSRGVEKSKKFVPVAAMGRELVGLEPVSRNRPDLLPVNSHGISRFSEN
jgi:hypothetical protein